MPPSQPQLPLPQKHRLKLTFAADIAINYSSGLSLQLLGHYFHAIPRFIWSFLVALVVAILAIVGKDHLSTIVSNFVSLLGYWVSVTMLSSSSTWSEDGAGREHETRSSCSAHFVQ